MCIFIYIEHLLPVVFMSTKYVKGSYLLDLEYYLRVQVPSGRVIPYAMLHLSIPVLMNKNPWSCEQ